MHWRKIVADYFSFTRKDRIAVVTLLLMIITILVAPKFIGRKNAGHPINADTVWIASMKKLEISENNKPDYENSFAFQHDRSTSTYPARKKQELFYFDPNEIGVDEWQRLGLRPKTISTIQKYLGKGGRFKDPEDLKKVYGLFPDEYERIAAFVRIKTTSERTAPDPETSSPAKPEKKYTARYSVIDINSADTSAFIALPGIGSKLALRIVSFRDKLGGFYSINQVSETFGLADSTFQKIKQYLNLDEPQIRKISINSATLDEMKAHPYIKWSIANPVVSYRNEHGPFKKIEDIKNVMAVTQDVYEKLLPYLTL